MIFAITRCWVLLWMPRSGPNGPEGRCVMDYVGDKQPEIHWSHNDAMKRARDLAVHQRVWIEELTGERWHCPKEVEPEVPE